MSGPCKAHDLETGALSRQLGSATDRADNQVRKRDRDVESAVGLGLEIRRADRCLGHAGRILSTCNEQRREGVRKMSLRAKRSGQHAAQ